MANISSVGKLLDHIDIAINAQHMHIHVNGQHTVGNFLI